MGTDNSAQGPADPREERIRRVLVVGGGSSGWMAAAYLATSLSRDVEITLVESDAIGIVGVGEATIPPIQAFNNFLKIDERAFLGATQGTFKLGIEFHNWGQLGDRYLHQFGRTGREIDAVVQLHHWWRVGQLAGGADYPRWEDMFPARALAKHDRFALPDQNPQNPLGRFTYAYHFDAQAYAGFLARLAQERGAKRTEGIINHVERDAASGDILAVRLENGTRIEADLFIDCSGFRSLLLGQELGEAFDDWSRWIPNDRALAVPSQAAANGPTPYTRGTAHSVGWQWRIPLQHRTGNGHVFCSAFSSEEDAEARLMATLDTPALDNPRLIKFTTGRRRRAWVNNVVGLGLSSGFLEPLESTSIHFVQAGLERLIENFPTRHMDAGLRDRFNRETSLEWERVRDFIIAHYKVTQRTDSDFWNHVRTMEIPDSLSQRLELWQARGVLDIEGNHLFQLGSWSALLIGQGLQPLGVHALTDRAPPEFAAQQIRKIASELDDLARNVPSHADFIARYCPAAA